MTAQQALNDAGGTGMPGQVEFMTSGACDGRQSEERPDGSFDPPVEVKRRVRIDWQRSEQAARSTVKNETVSHLPASPRKSRAA